MTVALLDATRAAIGFLAVYWPSESSTPATKETHHERSR